MKSIFVFYKVSLFDDKDYFNSLKFYYISPNTIGKFNLFHSHKLQKWYAVC